MTYFPNLSKLDQWPSPATIRTAADSVGTAGATIRDEVVNARTEWKSISDYYSSSGGDAVTLAGAFSLPKDRAENLKTATDEVKSALSTWADDIEGLHTRRTTARQEAASFPGDLPEDDPLFETERLRINQLINTTVQDYNGYVDDCVGALNGIEIPIANEYGTAYGAGATTTGYFKDLGGTFYYEYEPPRMPTFSRREFLRGIPNLAQGLDPDGRPVKVELPEPDLNRPITVSGNGLDADGNRLTQPRGVRIGGGALAILGAGFTFASEREAAEERVIQENPDISDEELESRVGQETLVRGGSSIATGAVTGLAIGAAVGSIVPVAGTAVGAVVGLVGGTLVGIALEASGVQEKINDGAMWLWDNAAPDSVKEVGGEVGDFVGDLVTGKWGELFD